LALLICLSLGFVAWCSYNFNRINRRIDTMESKIIEEFNRIDSKIDMMVDEFRMVRKVIERKEQD
jgi:hypothetical protein